MHTLRVLLTSGGWGNDIRVVLKEMSAALMFPLRGLSKTLRALALLIVPLGALGGGFLYFPGAEGTGAFAAMFLAVLYLILGMPRMSAIMLAVVGVCASARWAIVGGDMLAPVGIFFVIVALALWFGRSSERVMNPMVYKIAGLGIVAVLLAASHFIKVATIVEGGGVWFLSYGTLWFSGGEPPQTPAMLQAKETVRELEDSGRMTGDLQYCLVHSWDEKVMSSAASALVIEELKATGRYTIELAHLMRDYGKPTDAWNAIFYVPVADAPYMYRNEENASGIDWREAGFVYNNGMFWNGGPHRHYAAPLVWILMVVSLVSWSVPAMSYLWGLFPQLSVPHIQWQRLRPQFHPFHKA